MTRVFKAGIATAALTIAAGFALPATAADLGGYSRGGSIKDGYVAPMPEVRAPAGPCYVRADVGYSLSGDPEVGFPTAIDTYTTNIWVDGTRQELYNRQVLASEASGVSMDNTWLAEGGIGCSFGGSRGVRIEGVLGYHGNRDIDALPGGGATDFFVTRRITNDFRPAGPDTDTNDGAANDPLHTSLKSYTLMMNAYKDLGNFGGFTPYVGGGIGVAYHMLKEVHFTNSALHNRIEGDNELAFAWALMAGVGYQISDRAILDFGYRYIDMGKASSGRVDNALNVNPRVNIDDITAHEFKVGLRYHFGQSDCCGAPAYMPMK